jgi:hypothetical protein
MRAGCIPIVDNQGGFVEQIAEGCGFLCDDESEFHSAIGGIQSLKNRREFPQSCQSHADQPFSLSGFRKRLLKQFNRIGINAARENESCAVD